MTNKEWKAEWKLHNHRAAPVPRKQKVWQAVRQGAISGIAHPPLMEARTKQRLIKEEASVTTRGALGPLSPGAALMVADNIPNVEATAVLITLSKLPRSPSCHHVGLRGETVTEHAATSRI